MNKEFIPYEQALELKDLGFNEPYIAGYDGTELKYITQKFRSTEPSIPAPLYQQAFRWFREEYQLYAWVKVEYEYGGVTPTYYITGKRQDDIPGGPFNTYEEAELACLKKLIEIIKG